MARKRQRRIERRPGYRQERRAFMQSLIAERHALARKLDREAYDKFWADTYLRLFPNA